jgi:hypothetical protein
MNASELLNMRRDEAMALFHANQAGRNAAERVAVVIVALASIAAAAGIERGSIDVVIPLPALYALLLSYAFQQYADVTVIGAARRRLEDLVNQRLGATALVYETAVAPIRKVPPLSVSVRVLQVLVGVIVAAVLAVASVAAADETVLVRTAYWIGTLLCFGSAGLSFRAMHQSWDEAVSRLDESVPMPPADEPSSG